MIRIALYGSSLFLSAIAAALKEHDAIRVLSFPDPIDVHQIIRLKPSVVLWRCQGIQPDIDRLWEAGVWLLEVDERQSVVIASHRSQITPQPCAVQQAVDLVNFIQILLLPSPAHNRRNG